MQMNPKIKVNGFNSLPFDDLVGKPNILIDLTNDPCSKLKSVKISDKLKIPFITASTSKNKGKVMVYTTMSKTERIILSKKGYTQGIDEYLLPDFENCQQGNITSGLIAGLVTEEIRKSILKLYDYDKLMKKGVTYNLLSNRRFKDECDINLSMTNYLNEKNLFKNKKAAIIGAGSIGNFVGIGLSLMGFDKIYLIDMDEIEEHNKNRQIAYTLGNYSGKKKIDILSRLMNKINPITKTIGIYGKLGTNLNKEERRKQVKLINESEFLKLDCDLILGCLDNISARAFANRLAVKNSIPYIDGGTSPFSGQVRVYSPGKTACLDCQENIYYQAIEEQNKQEISDHCTANDHEPSVIMSNQIIGAAILGEIRTLFYPEVYGQPVMNSILYNSFDRDRLILNRIKCKPNKDCLCSKKFYDK